MRLNSNLRSRWSEINEDTGIHNSFYGCHKIFATRFGGHVVMQDLLSTPPGSQHLGFNVQECLCSFQPTLKAAMSLFLRAGQICGRNHQGCWRSNNNLVSCAAVCTDLLAPLCRLEMGQRTLRVRTPQAMLWTRGLRVEGRTGVGTLILTSLIWVRYVLCVCYTSHVYVMCHVYVTRYVYVTRCVKSLFTDVRVTCTE